MKELIPTFITIFFLGIVFMTICARMIVFMKAGQPGLASFIPFYADIVECRIAGRSYWRVACHLALPPVMLITIPWSWFDLAKPFGKGFWYGLGLALLPWFFFPLLALGGARYQGPGGLGYCIRRGDDIFHRTRDNLEERAWG